MDLDWTSQLADQLDWQWDNSLRPKLAGLTDDEYLWEPVAGCWNVRPRSSGAPVEPGGEAGGGTRAPGSGPYTVDFAWPEPDPPPVTTIAWRLAHVIVGVFGMRAANHFGAPPVSYDNFPYAGTAQQALTQLDQTYTDWRDGVRALSAAELARPCGAAEGPFSAYPLATLVLHINREALHHGAEILLLRDLYRNRGTLAPGRDVG
ncbi:MAG TPA: DinB family protein [Pseudonocardia sp.]|jgi:hypothetical protein|nr:DinB family protein [Pseudonocardia sp.]